MNCPECGHENRDGAAFCEACGASQALACPKCNNRLRIGAAFCDQCGASLSASAPPAATTSSDDGQADAERRQLTVVFCDIVGSTQLSDQLDPEALRDLVRSFQETTAEIISDFGGHVAQYLGDGVLIYFGYPTAHEDDPARAVRAALQVLESLRELNLESTEPVAVRTGIHTGKVVVGVMGGAGRHERLALGDTPNIASRVTGKAEPNELLITAATLKLVRGLFAVEEVGATQLRGLEEPLVLYRVVGKGIAQSRFEAAVDAGLSALAGREKELQLLAERWQDAKLSRGQVVLLSGEAGIGKSRLVRELQNRAAADDVTRIEISCSAHHQNTALYPLIELLQRLLQFTHDDTPKTRLEKLGATLATLDFPRHDTLAILATLLSLPHPPGRPQLDLSPHVLKQKTQEALISWVLEQGSHGPVLVTWEDLHWADPSTLELVNLYIDQVPTAQIMILLTTRPGSSVRLDSRSFISQVALHRLAREDIHQVVLELSGGRALPPEVLVHVVEKTDGVPLFVEELTRMLLESPLLKLHEGQYVLTGPLPPLAIPVTLHDSLMARLDQLSSIREVAQVGATLGREFSYELISRVSSLDESRLQNELTELVRAELFLQKGMPPNAHYIFKHALIQDAAYDSMLVSTRQSVHAQVARVLEEHFPETVSGQPEVLANHYTEAGVARRAIDYWRQAGKRSVQASANAEAVNHFTRAVALIDSLEDDADNAAMELALQTDLGTALMVLRGYASPEVEAAYARAGDLCKQLPESSPQRFRVLEGLWGFHVVRGELGTAHSLGLELLDIAARSNDRAQLLEAHYALSAASFYMGKFDDALSHANAGCELYDEERQRRGALQDTGVACHCYAAWSLWHLDHTQQAHERSEIALALARRLDHPISLAWALDFAAMLKQHDGDIEGADQLADRAAQMCREHGFTFWLALARMIQGWCQSTRDDPVVANGGEAELRSALGAWRGTGAQLATPYWMGLLADAMIRDPGNRHREDEALAVVDQALAIAHGDEDRFYEAELHRVRGGLQVRLGDELQAESSRRNAHACATRQGARAWLRRIEDLSEP